MIKGYENRDREGVITGININKKDLQIDYLSKTYKESTVFIENIDILNYEARVHNAKRISFSGSSYLSGDSGLIKLYDDLDKIVAIIGANIELPFNYHENIYIQLDDNKFMLYIYDKVLELGIGIDNEINIKNSKYFIFIERLWLAKSDKKSITKSMTPRFDFIIIEKSD